MGWLYDASTGHTIDTIVYVEELYYMVGLKHVYLESLILVKSCSFVDLVAIIIPPSVATRGQL